MTCEPSKLWALGSNPSGITLPIFESPQTIYLARGDSLFCVPIDISQGRHGIEEDVARVLVFSGDHPEDVEVLGTVGQGQFNLHAVVVGVGEDAVLRDVLY